MVPTKGKALKMKKLRENNDRYAGGEQHMAQTLLKSLGCMLRTHGTPCINLLQKQLNPGAGGSLGIRGKLLEE